MKVCLGIRRKPIPFLAYLTYLPFLAKEDTACFLLIRNDLYWLMRGFTIIKMLNSFWIWQRKTGSTKPKIPTLWAWDILGFLCVKWRLLFLKNALHGPCQQPTLVLQKRSSLIGATAPGHAFQLSWRHQMETFSELLAICVGNSPVTVEFPSQRPATRSYDIFFDLRLNKRLSK